MFGLQFLGSGEFAAPSEVPSLTKTYSVGTKSKGMQLDITSIRKATAYCLLTLLFITSSNRYSLEVRLLYLKYS